MLHLVARLDRDHDRAVQRIAAEVASALGVEAQLAPAPPHVTILAFSGLDAPTALEAVRASVQPMTALRLHAHGYGVWAGTSGDHPSLHVQVVRDAALDALHRCVAGALTQAGAEVAGWTTSASWSPHITVVSPELAPAQLGVALGHLLRHHHPSWRVPIDRLQILSKRVDGDTGSSLVRLRPRCP